MSSGSIGPYLVTNYSNSRTWSGTNNPNPPYGEHPYTMEQYRIFGDKTKTVRKNLSGQWYTTYGYDSDKNPDIARNFLSSSLADSHCQSKMTSQVKLFSSAVFMATLPQSVGQIAHLGGSVLGAALAIKNGNPAGAFRSLLRAGTGSGSSVSQLYRMRREAMGLKDAGGQWLAFQYGWKPLLSDIYDLCNLADGLRKKQKYVTRVSSKTKDVYKPANQLLSCEREVFVSRKYVLQEPPSANLTLGLIDPLSVAWELVPFSFVVDWFLPVGSFLENLNVLPNLNGTVVKGVLQRNSLHQGSFNLVLSDSQGPVLKTGGSCHASCVKHVRTVSNIASDSVVRPSFKPWDKSLSEGHIKNAAALITGMLSSFKR